MMGRIGRFEDGRRSYKCGGVEVWRWKKKCGVLHPSPEGGDILQRRDLSLRTLESLPQVLKGRHTSVDGIPQRSGTCT
jgi:hypothetical protein